MKSIYGAIFDKVFNFNLAFLKISSIWALKSSFTISFHIQKFFIFTITNQITCFTTTTDKVTFACVCFYLVMCKPLNVGIFEALCNLKITTSVLLPITYGVKFLVNSEWNFFTWVVYWIYFGYFSAIWQIVLHQS